ncbi:MAG: hypothetical protein EZS28_050733, partial [Streblomastix strix]
MIDQRHVIPASYEALTQIVNGSMFDCFVDQDVVSAPSDLYHSLTFENVGIQDGNNKYYGADDGSAWKLATNDSFMRGYNSTKIGARTHIQVNLTPLMHYLCDAVVRIMFDDAPYPQ